MLMVVHTNVVSTGKRRRGVWIQLEKIQMKDKVDAAEDTK
jgi:hypothetical protein